MQMCEFINNRARRNGGAVAAVDLLPEGELIFTGCHFRGNIARRGGALFVNGIASLDMRRANKNHTVFEGNRALSGGAIYARLENQLRNSYTSVDTEFRDNLATDDTAEVGHK